MPSWCGAQLKKKITGTIYLYYTLINCILRYSLNKWGKINVSVLTIGIFT
jgi:hypothetical protein